MQELVGFVSGAMIGGVVGNTTYDGLKIILGSSFDMLLKFLSNNEKAEFKGALTILLMQNEELKKQIEQLQQGKEISTTIIIQTHSGLGDNVGGDKITNNKS